PRAAARRGIGRAGRVRAGRRRFAADAAGTGQGRRPGGARQPVLRAGLAVLPRGRRAPAVAPRRDRGPGRPARLATERRHAGQRRAQPGGAPLRGQPRRSGHGRPAYTRRDAGGGGHARRRDRRGRVRVGAGVAAGADAAADPRHPAVRLRAGRGVLAPLSVPESGDAAARSGRPGARPAAARRAADRADRNAGGDRRYPSGADPALRAGRTFDPRRGGLVPAPRRVPVRALDRMAAGARGGAHLAQRHAVAATLPAVLALQPDRPDVGRAAVDRRGADPAVARGPAALRVQGAFADLPLVRAVARHRGQRRRARGHGAPAARAARPARRARRAPDGAAVVCRRVVRAAQPHPAGSRQGDPQRTARSDERVDCWPMPDRDPDLRTRLAEAGRHLDARVRTANLPVHRASTVLFDTLAEAEAAGQAVGSGARHATTYGTAGTPTTMALMDALIDIEGGGHDVRAALMPSGLAAITTVLLALLEPGDHVLVTDAAYGPTRVFCDGLLARLGVQTTWYDPTIGAGIEALVRPETKLIWLESPGSYTFEMQDVPAICAVARERGVLTVIDNTWASPVFARPFDWGVDVSVLALTKYWSGHSDVLMGAVVAREPVWPKLWSAVRQLGQCVGGDDAYLVLRGLRTADVRMRRHQESALAVAHW